MLDETIYTIEKALEQDNEMTMTMPVAVDVAASLRYPSIRLMTPTMTSNIVFV